MLYWIQMAALCKGKYYTLGTYQRGILESNHVIALQYPVVAIVMGVGIEEVL